MNESGVEPAAGVDPAPQHYQCRVQSRYTTPAGARGGNRTPIASMSRSHSALELRGQKIGRAPRMCAALLLYPKQAGRFLPLSPKRSDLQRRIFSDQLRIRLVVLRPVGADRAGDRQILKTLTPHPVMNPEEAKKSREPSPLRPGAPGRRDVRHVLFYHRKAWRDRWELNPAWLSHSQPCHRNTSAP